MIFCIDIENIKCVIIWKIQPACYNSPFINSKKRTIEVISDNIFFPGPKGFLVWTSSVYNEKTAQVDTKVKNILQMHDLSETSAFVSSVGGP